MLLLILGVVFSLPSLFLIHQVYMRYKLLKVPSSLDSVNSEKKQTVEQTEKSLQPDVLKEIATLMKGDPLVFKKPKLLRGWKHYFSGKAAVKWLKEKGIVSTEEDAVRIGNFMLERKIIVPENSDNIFESKSCHMYKFATDEASNEPRQLEDMDDTVVFVPGIFRDESLWVNWKKAFEEKGFKVYTPSLLGHSSSTKHDSTVLDFVENLDQYLTDLGCVPYVRRVTLIGQDVGSLIVQLLASRGYATTAILISPLPPSGLNFGALHLKLKYGKGITLPKYEKARKNFLNAFSGSPNSIGSNILESEAREQYAKMEAVSGKVEYEKYLQKSFEIPPSKLNCPLLIVGGKEDKICTPYLQNRIADRYKQAENRIYPGHSHYIMLEDNSGNRAGWEGVASDVLSWIAANRDSRKEILGSLKERHTIFFGNKTPKPEEKPNVTSEVK